MNFSKDYYAILHVGKSASKVEIKAAYRMLAKQYHPDKNPGDSLAEEHFKEINEAHEVLSNDITRHIYDEYTRKEKSEPLHAENGRPNQPKKNVYSKTVKEVFEKRVYVKGKILVKFWGELEASPTIIFQSETSYRINANYVEVVIEESDIYPLESPPSEFQKSYKESEIFQTPLSRPINCIIQTSTGEENYKLALQGIKIKSPVIKDVTKFEGQSLGTLTGDIYGYVVHLTEKESQVEVTECSGETGNTESKEENGQTYSRKEYYYHDCTTFWSDWEMVSKGGGGKDPARRAETADTGLRYFGWLIFAILAVIIFPNLFPVFLFFIVLWDIFWK